ncbi:MAG: TonB family protein [Dysgonamonadaceae bacterium]|jgi:protein TonB|nr:TonB family protein [Dysgonamonadaceae bacterium]
MEAKKTPKADLENKRTIFFLMGFAVVLSAFYVLMEWRSNPPDSNYYPELLAPAFIEKEYGADIDDRQTALAIELEKKEQEHPVYEGYEVVEKISQEEETQDLIEPEQVLEPESQKEEKTVQPPETDTNANDVDTEAEVMPQFPGGNVELIRYIYNHIQYPPAALKQRIQGRVWCSFIVNRDGTVSDVVLEQGVYIFLDEEAVRVLETMPLWIPGKTQGKNVSVKVYLPIVFKI